MAKFATKALIVAALVCLVFDGGCAEETLDKIVGKMDAGKIKDDIKEYATRIAITASETANKVKDVITESEIGKKLANKLEKPITQMKDLKNKTKKKLDQYMKTAKTTINRVEDKLITKETKKKVKNIARTAKAGASEALKKVKKEIKDSTTLNKIHEKLEKSKAKVKEVIGEVEDKFKGSTDSIIKRIYTARTLSELFGLKGKSKAKLDRFLNATRKLTANFSSDFIEKLNVTDHPRKKLAASDDSVQQRQNDYNVEEVMTTTPVPPPSSFKDKVKGFVNTVKEGASDALESVNEKRKEAVAGTKKFVSSTIDKIKHSYDSFKHGDSSEEQVPRVPESAEEQAKVVVDQTNDMLKNEKRNL